MASTVRIDDLEIPMRDGETVLEALERKGVPMLYSCRTGVCQSCLLKSLGGTVPPKAQQGLKDSLKAQNYFLSCVCVPEDDMQVTLPGEGLDHRAIVRETDDIGAAVRRLRFSVPDKFEWFAGQYITVIRSDGIARSYSIASSSADGYIELHVRRIPGGALSGWLHDEVKPGHEMVLRGPFGDCFYVDNDLEAPLLLAGTGTGLAPLYGIMHDALRRGHRGPIMLFHGALGEEGLYQREELEKLSVEGRIDYRACLLRGEQQGREHIVIGSLDEVVLSHPLDLKKARAYLCGDPALVEKMKKQLFLKGLSNRRIFADAFVATATKKD